MSVSLCEKPINLLYIEDDKSLCSLVSDLLSRHSKNFDFNITLKNSLEEGLDYLSSHKKDDKKIDLILLDLILPNSHGVGTFKRVKELCPNIPVVIISGHADIACDCVKLGAQDYLIKTELTGPTLIRSIKYAIERSTSENMYKDIIKTSPIGYHIYRLKESDIIFVNYNPAANKILKIDHSKLLFKKLEEVFPNISDDLKRKYMDVLLSGSMIKDLTTEYEDENIKKSYYRVNAHRTKSGDLAVSFEDITCKILMKEKLTDSENRYKQLVEATGAGVYEIDFVNMKFSYVNDVICKNSGYTKEEMLEMSPFDFLTEEGAEKFISRIKRLKKGEYIQDAAEYEAIRKDGSSIWIMLTARYKEDEQGNVIGASVVAIDITDKVLAEKMLKRKEAEVFTQLEHKIQTWKQEMLQKDIERDKTLNLINKEINFMSIKDDSEVL